MKRTGLFGTEVEYLSVRELRAALSSVPDDTPVWLVVRVTDENEELEAEGVHYDGERVVIS